MVDKCCSEGIENLEHKYEQDLLPLVLMCEWQLYFLSQANFSCKKQRILYMIN